MKRNKFLKVLLFSLCMLGLGVVYANTRTEPVLRKNVKAFFNYQNNGKADKAADLYNNFSLKDIKNFAQYMEVHPEKVVPLYYMLTADYFTYKGEYDKGYLWFIIGKYRATQDVLMCEDKSAQSQIGIYNDLAPVTGRYFQKKNARNDKYIADMHKKLLEWDEAHPERVSPMWACYHGINAFFEEPRLLPEDKQAEIKQELRNSYLKLIDELYADAKK